MKIHLLAVACIAAIHISVSPTKAEDSAVSAIQNIAYKSGADLTEYERERCQLDLYLPAKRDGFATLVWFHGGGLTGGSKDGKDTVKIARSLAGAGIAMAVPNYRLSPKAMFPAYVEDAAAAVAWTHQHIREQGGDASQVFIGGHSAGAYLTLMLGMDLRFLEKHGLAQKDIAGLIPVRGQTMTHYTVRGERGQGGRFAVTADDASPAHYARKDTAPMLLIYADRDMPARAEENEYFAAVLRGTGNERVTVLKVADREHGSVGHKIAEPDDPARRALLDFMSAKAAR
jgi:acetyl esterase/lipase